MNIDWSKAPEGTTHWDPVDRNHLKQLGKISQRWNIRFGWEASPWQYPDDLSSMDRLIARPIWNGEGLPPVGTVCEFYADEDTWQECKIVGENEGYLIVWVTHAHIWTAKSAALLRPIRTPEQIAAEERQGEINELADKLAGYDDELSTQDRHLAMATYLIDQGYGKKVAP